MGTFNGTALGIGLFSLAILILCPKIKGIDRIPPSLIAVLLAGAAVKVLDLPVNTIAV